MQALGHRRSLIAWTFLGGLIVLVSASLAAPPKLLISRQSAAAGGAQAERAVDPSISASGRFVAFASGSANLSDLDDETPGGVFDMGIGRLSDIFVRDVDSEETILVSRGPVSSGNAAADNASIDPDISGDGRRVAFTSAAANFSSDDRDTRTSPATGTVFPVLDVFVRDLDSGDTILVSRRGAAGGAGGGDSSFAPAISANGRFVAFASDAENLSARDRAGTDVFVRDLVRRRTILVSRAGREAGNELSTAPAISADGRFVAFASRSTNFNRRDRDVDVDIYLRDLARNRTVLVSRGSAHGDATQPTVSGNGNQVAFVWEQRDRTRASDDSPLNVHVFNVRRGRTRLVSARAGAGRPPRAYDAVLPEFSRPGSFVAFVARERDPRGEDDDQDADIHVRNLRSGRMVLAAGAAGNTGVENSNPSLSRGGRFLAFEEEPNESVGLSEPRQVFRTRPFG